jgi:hypothetical protein
MPPQPQNALEDLVVENRRTYSPELTTARAMPRDQQATDDLKGDSDRMERLADLAEVEPERIVDVAVRGRNVSFVVADGLDDAGVPTGAISTGFFALSDLDGGDKAKARKRGGVRSRPKVPRAPRGGTATVPSEAAPERGTAETEPAGPEQPGTGPAPGAVPDNLSELNADDTAALFADAPEGVDLGAVLAAEQARDNPRLTVLRAAEKAGVG